MSKKLPAVAIVGRANVGKSSLFNRLVGKQQAIVAREAGTTRDSVVGQVSYDRHSFWLVDTAGLKSPDDEFEASIQEQIEEATSSADVIVVVIDSTVIPNDEDFIVARKALRSKKPTILVANKSDKAEALPSEEFMKLGITNIVRTSAEHKSGIYELLDEIANLIPPKVKTQDSEMLTLALIGRPNVGKSSLFNTLAGKQQALISQTPGTTRDVGRVRVRFNNYDIEILDTAGIRRSGKIETGVEKFSVLRSLKAIEEADICLLVMDVNELNVALDQKLAGIIKEAGKGLIIVVNKWDSIEDKTANTRDNVAKEISLNYQFVPWAPLIFTSASTGQNVAKIFDIAMDILKRRRQQLKTTDLNRVIQRSLREHPPAGINNFRPRPRYLVQTDISPPWFVLFGSNLRMLHWSYKRYLEHAMRDNFDFIGTPIEFSFRDSKREGAKDAQQD